MVSDMSGKERLNANELLGHSTLDVLCIDKTGKLKSINFLSYIVSQFNGDGLTTNNVANLVKDTFKAMSKVDLNLDPKTRRQYLDCFKKFYTSEEMMKSDEIRDLWIKFSPTTVEERAPGANPTQLQRHLPAHHQDKNQKTHIQKSS